MTRGPQADRHLRHGPVPLEPPRPDRQPLPSRKGPRCGQVPRCVASVAERERTLYAKVGILVRLAVGPDRVTAAVRAHPPGDGIPMRHLSAPLGARQRLPVRAGTSAVGTGRCQWRELILTLSLVHPASVRRRGRPNRSSSMSGWSSVDLGSSAGSTRVRVIADAGAKKLDETHPGIPACQGELRPAARSKSAPAGRDSG